MNPRKQLHPLIVLTFGSLLLTACGQKLETTFTQVKTDLDKAAPSNTTSPNGSGEIVPTAGGRFILLTNGNSPYWDACRVGMDDAAKKFSVNAVLEVNDGTIQGQLDKLRQFGSQADVVGIGVCAIEANSPSIAEELEKLIKQGKHVVTIDSDFDPKFHSARFAYLGTNNVAGGEALGTAVKNLRPEGGEYVTFVGLTGAQNAKERVAGCATGAGEKLKSLDNMGDNLDRTKARENVRNAIRNHPDLNVLVGIWSYNAPAIVDVVKELGKREQYKVAVFDAEPLAIKYMAEGQIDVMVVQNPYEIGFQAIRLLQAMSAKQDATIKEMFPNHGQPGGDLFDTGLKVVIPDEGSPLKAEMFSEKTNFQKLGEFKAWLEKYKLTGS